MIFMQMLDFIKSQPSILERLMSHIETPAIVDLIFRMLHMDDSSGSSGVVEARRPNLSYVRAPVLNLTPVS